jgi:HlyD family secretion protein
MTRVRPVLALRHMSTLFGLGAAGGLTDGHLLETFSTGHREAAEAAFATLVERHGPMVLRVCRGVLGDSHDVHDPGQTTFTSRPRRARRRPAVRIWRHTPGSIGTCESST